MRDIKFRAMNFGGYWYLSDKHGLTEFFNFLECDSPVLNKQTLGQFTGLKDKNGKEIYEGDIVSWGGSMYGFGQVVYEEYSFVVKYKLGKVLDTMYFNHPDAYTVIGNIHENPDLVNPEKGVGK